MCEEALTQKIKQTAHIEDSNDLFSSTQQRTTQKLNAKQTYTLTKRNVLFCGFNPHILHKYDTLGQMSERSASHKV